MTVSEVQNRKKKKKVEEKLALNQLNLSAVRLAVSQKANECSAQYLSISECNLDTPHLTLSAPNTTLIPPTKHLPDIYFTIRNKNKSQTQ